MLASAVAVLRGVVPWMLFATLVLWSPSDAEVFSETLSEDMGVFNLDDTEITHQWDFFIWTIPARKQHRTSIKLRMDSRCSDFFVKIFTGKPMQQMKMNYTARDSHETLIAIEEEVLIKLRGSLGCGTFRGEYAVEPINWRKRTANVSNAKGAKFTWCANGGGIILSGSLFNWNAQCACPPGFGGLRCEKACGPNLYGPDCQKECSDGPFGCRGVQFCADKSCTCAAGLTGEYCNDSCEEGSYGANCTERCGRCFGGDTCDMFSGHCPNGCLPGYVPPTCQNELPHLFEPPTVIADGGGKLVGNFRVPVMAADPTLRMRYYDLQYQVVGEEEWTSLSKTKLQIPPIFNKSFTLSTLKAEHEHYFSEDDYYTGERYTFYSDATFPESFEATGIPPGKRVFVRVLLLNEDMESYKHVPHSYVCIPGTDRLTDLKVANVTSRSIQLTWTAARFKHGDTFYVVTECLSVVPCTGPCSQETSTQVVTMPRALLDRLVPAAKYRITVWSGVERLSVVVNTALEEPQGKVSPLRLAAQTNSSALFTWESATECEKVHGPISHYGYCFDSAGSKESGCDASRAKNTSETTVSITDLQPLTDYKFSVIQYNPAGSNAESSAVTINLTTHHTVPDPPRELDVYRLNRTALWLRWLPPGRPSGALRWYTVEVVPVVTPGSAKPKHRSERVAAGTRCGAWPDHVCYIVGRLRPRVTYLITVSATNEHGDLPGEHATVKSTTDKKVSEPPQDLQAVDITERSALIRWKLPSKLNSDLTYFEVAVARRLFSEEEEEVGEDSEDPDPQRVPVTAELPQYEYALDGLQPGASYTVTVSCGYVGKTSTIDFTTRLPEEEQFLEIPEEGKEKT